MHSHNRQTTKRPLLQVRASSSFSVHPRGLEHAAKLLWPELELQRGRARRMKLLQALQVGDSCWDFSSFGNFLGVWAEGLNPCCWS